MTIEVVNFTNNMVDNVRCHDRAGRTTVNCIFTLHKGTHTHTHTVTAVQKPLGSFRRQTEKTGRGQVQTKQPCES